MAIAKSNHWEADRVQELPFQGTRKMLEAANKLKAEGKDIVDMTTGRPDFDTPQNIKEACKDALEAGMVHYASNYGVQELRVAIANKMKRDNGLDFSPDNEIMVTLGCVEAVSTALTTFLNPGDEVIIPMPIWLNYAYIPKMLGANIVPVLLREEKNFAVTAEDIEKCITPKTKALVLVSPNNPTGGVMLEEDLRAIAQMAVKHDFIVITDEIYEHFIYDGCKHISIATMDGMRERTVTINGVSKAYSMTGWRIGWICAEKSLIESLVRTHQYAASCATTFAQYGAIEALNGPQESVKIMTDEYDRRRKLMVDSINSMPRISCVSPKGAFYVFANVKELKMTSEEAAQFFLREAGLAAVHGSAFGDGGEGYMRMAYTTSYENIQRGLERLDSALRKL